MGESKTVKDETFKEEKKLNQDKNSKSMMGQYSSNGIIQASTQGSLTHLHSGKSNSGFKNQFGLRS